jgi:hypothetical protein
MNEESKVAFPLPKHKQDNRPESCRRASPTLLPVFQGTELDLWAFVRFETRFARIHLSAHGHPPLFRECLVKGSGWTACLDIARSRLVPMLFSIAPTVLVSVSRADPHPETLPPSVSPEGIARIHSDRRGDQGNVMPESAAAVPLWDRQRDVRYRKRMHSARPGVWRQLIFPVLLIVARHPGRFSGRSLACGLHARRRCLS